MDARADFGFECFLAIKKCMKCFKVCSVLVLLVPMVKYSDNFIRCQCYFLYRNTSGKCIS